MQSPRVPPGPAQPGTLPGAALEDALAFGRFVLLVQARELLADGRPVHIGTRAVDLLVALANRQGRLVTGKQHRELLATPSCHPVTRVASPRAAGREGFGVHLVGPAMQRRGQSPLRDL